MIYSHVLYNKKKDTVRTTFTSFIFQKSQIYKDTIFQDVPIFFLYFVKHFGNNWEVCGAGPYLNTNFEVPKII